MTSVHLGYLRLEATDMHFILRLRPEVLGLVEGKGQHRGCVAIYLRLRLPGPPVDLWRV